MTDYWYEGVEEKEPVEKGLESIVYDIDHYGACTDEEPCHGLQSIMEASDLKGGGIVGIVESSEDAVPNLVGFLPAPSMRRGRMLALNFCPCCGKDLREKRSLILGLAGPTLLQ
jgi:hypothetical protein